MQNLESLLAPPLMERSLDNEGFLIESFYGSRPPEMIELTPSLYIGRWRDINPFTAPDH